MRDLKLKIEHCSECPYFRFTAANDYMYPLCYQKEDSPFALVGLTGGNWQKGMDLRCALPENLVGAPPPKSSGELFRDETGKCPAVEDFLSNWDWDNEPVEPAKLVEALEEWILNQDSVVDLGNEIGVRGVEQMVVWILERYYSEI